MTRCRLNRLRHVDVKTGEPVRRYEHETPGALIHVDVKKLGNTPDGGGWRFVGRAQGFKHRSATAAKTGLRDRQGGAATGTAFVHTVIDDHSRVAYAEVHGDETAATAIGVLQRATSWFAVRGITVERMLCLPVHANQAELTPVTCTGDVVERTATYRKALASD